MEHKGNCFCTVCRYQYATMKLNMIKFTPAVGVSALENLAAVSNKRKGFITVCHNMVYTKLW